MPEKGQNAISKMLDLLSSRDLGDNDIDSFIRDLNQLIGYDTTGEGLGINLFR